MSKTPGQIALPLIERKRRGGARKGAGRKPNGVVAGVPHQTRFTHKARHPVHVTMKAREGLPSLRGDKLILRAVRASLAAAHKEAFRVVHFSVQSNHLHLIVEAEDTVSLSRGMQGLTSRMARAVNRALGNKGAIFADRYHAHALSTPRATRNALLYVLQNWAKHGPGGAYDPHSSAIWFDGWAHPLPDESPPPLVAKASTWLITIGWRRHGLLRTDERPGKPQHAHAA